MMLDLLLLASGVGVVAAIAALWVQRSRREHRRVFAGLVSISVTLTLFSGVAWGATEAAEGAPQPLAWMFVGTLALLFALRLYRQLQQPPSEAHPALRFEQSDKTIGKRR
jgi:peptidoglycan/LPS O-acetylase OafA/YrhL